MRSTSPGSCVGTRLRRLAQDAGMPLSEFEDFLYDWCCSTGRPSPPDDSRTTLRSSTLPTRCGSSAKATDLRLSLAGPPDGSSTQAKRNMPGGEFFGCPVEDSAEGSITLRRVSAQLRDGRQLRNRPAALLRRGTVVDASADHQDYLLETLDTDPGARRLGELGIGCNPGITRYMGNVLLRREDRRLGPCRARIQLRRPRRHERVRDPLGPRRGSAERRPNRARRPHRPARRHLDDLTTTRTRLRACGSAGGSRGRGRRGRLP